MKTVGHMPGHPGAHADIGDHHPFKQFCIAFALAAMGALGFAALGLAAVMAGMPLFG
jgi:hypothetical protein